MVTLNLTDEEAHTLLSTIYGEEESLRHDLGDVETADTLNEIAGKLQNAL